MPRIVEDGGGGGGSGNFVLDSFVVTPAQTVFTLTAAPLTDGEVLFYVNGVLYQNGTDYTVVGTALTWTNALFPLGVPDFAQVYFQTP